MPDKFHPIIEKILSFERTWCETMHIYNPYNDPWSIKISKNVPDFDGPAFRKYRKHNFVYDKLWIAKSQGLKCGTLEYLIEHPSTNLEYPIFIKPRHGNKSASSKNCFKIKHHDELQKYKDIPEMIWSEFIAETEGMTDYIIHNGNVVHQITYIYSDTQHGTIADDWKFISPHNKPPTVIDTWVRANMAGYTGICNVQYRGDKIIEVGLRFARGGAYIYSTNNLLLIKSINDLVNYNKWDYSIDRSEFDFTEFYSFKCYSETPITYIFPQYLLDAYMKSNGCKEFYEYYFEPSGSGLSMVFYQFLHEDFDKGMKIKKNIERINTCTQLFFIFGFILALFIRFSVDKNIGNIMTLVIIILFLTKLLSPLSMHVNLWNAQKQAMTG